MYNWCLVDLVKPVSVQSFPQVEFSNTKEPFVAIVNFQWCPKGNKSTGRSPEKNVGVNRRELESRKPFGMLELINMAGFSGGRNAWIPFFSILLENVSYFAYCLEPALTQLFSTFLQDVFHPIAEKVYCFWTKHNVAAEPLGMLFSKQYISIVTEPNVSSKAVGSIQERCSDANTEKDYTLQHREKEEDARKWQQVWSTQPTK